MNKEIMKTMGFGKEVARVTKGLCTICAKVVKKSEFKDKKSKQEYKISGLCQKCQDRIFCC